MQEPGNLILCLNFGSSSLRFALFASTPAGALECRGRGNFQGIGTHAAEIAFSGQALLAPEAGDLPDHQAAAQALSHWLQTTGLQQQVTAVAHRIVHGGRHPSPQVLDVTLLQELQSLGSLAPLHQPAALQGVTTFRQLLPDSLQLACFDTSFHLTMPQVASRYALPEIEGLPLPAGRSGFHGLSYAYVTGVMQQQVPAARRLIIAHLGSGASLCAIADGHSLDTTMGLTPLDGVPMATRSGAIDPGLLLWLQEQRGMDAATLADLLYRRSGWLGLSGISSDMRTLLASDEPAARLAVEVFVYQCAKAVAGLCVPLGGLDALVFTGGVGERADRIRAAVVDRCAWLGLDLDDSANQQANDGDGIRCIATPESPAGIWVVPTDEEQTMATQAASLLRDA